MDGSASRGEALHDIMKINALLPTVQRADAPYRGGGQKTEQGNQMKREIR